MFQGYDNVFFSFSKVQQTNEYNLNAAIIPLSTNL